MIPSIAWLSQRNSNLPSKLKIIKPVSIRQNSWTIQEKISKIAAVFLIQVIFVINLFSDRSSNDNRYGIIAIAKLAKPTNVPFPAWADFLF
jgi:hypothetical protein